MHALKPGPRRVGALLIGATLTVALLAPSAASAASPVSISPKARAVLALGSRPVFKVRDTSAAARRYPLYITISTSKKLKRNGDLKRTTIGNFASMKRRGTLFRYKAEDYTFPDWYMARPGKYYWQAYRIDCAAARSCHVHTKVRSFTVE